MFADSWIGGISEGKHAPGSYMVNNAIAVHDSSNLGACRAPAYSDIEFFWGKNNKKGKPTAWIVPEHNPENEWYWFNGNGCVIPGKGGTDRLVMFLFKLTSKGEEGSVWNFKGTGSAMAIVDNFHEPPGKWKVRQVQIPYPIKTNQPGMKPEQRITNWGVSTYLPGQEYSRSSDIKLYIFGIDDTNPADKHLLLARVNPEDIERIELWEYYKGNDLWSAHMNDAGSVSEGLVSEISVDAINNNGKDNLILIQSEPMFGHRILARTADRPEGPWSDPIPIYTVPGLDRGKEYFTYAAKGHLDLSCKNELLVTYIINSTDFWEAAGDASIYRPRFVTIPLDNIIE
jgi:hypothetical protein